MFDVPEVRYMLLVCLSHFILISKFSVFLKQFFGIIFSISFPVYSGCDLQKYQL